MLYDWIIINNYYAGRISCGKRKNEIRTIIIKFFFLLISSTRPKLLFTREWGLLFVVVWTQTHSAGRAPQREREREKEMEKKTSSSSSPSSAEWRDKTLAGDGPAAAGVTETERVGREIRARGRDQRREERVTFLFGRTAAAASPIVCGVCVFFSTANQNAPRRLTQDLQETPPVAFHISLACLRYTLYILYMYGFYFFRPGNGNPIQFIRRYPLGRVIFVRNWNNFSPKDIYHHRVSVSNISSWMRRKTIKYQVNNGLTYRTTDVINVVD